MGWLCWGWGLDFVGSVTLTCGRVVSTTVCVFGYVFWIFIVGCVVAVMGVLPFVLGSLPSTFLASVRA